MNINGISKSAGSVFGRETGYRRRRYMILFYSLLLSIVAVPAFTMLGFTTQFLKIFFVANLLAAVFPIVSAPLRRIVIAFVVVTSIAQIASHLLNQSRVTQSSLAVWTLIALFGAYHAVRFAFRASKIDDEHIYAALSAYLLAGIFLGNLYLVLDSIWPGSLLVNGSTVEQLSVSRAIYFSFVTMSTVGYGDIVPNTDMTRSLAIVEAVAGQLYLVVMVARLVSLYTSRTLSGSHPDS